MKKRLAIIGAGPGGYVAAIRAAQRGAEVTVVEESEVGGTCLNWGCIPTKTIIASAETLERVRNAAEFGVEVAGTVQYNLDRIRERKDKVVATQIKGIRSLFKAHGIRLIEARGSLTPSGAVLTTRKDGTSVEIASDKVVLATGSRPSQLPGLQHDGSRIMNSDDAVQLRSIPEHILIIGAGVIGCEFAFIYRSFGTEITIVEMAPRPLVTEDEEISALMQREMKKAKIRLMTGITVSQVAVDGNGVQAVLSNGQSIRTDSVLVSIGRALNTEGLALDAAGIKTGPRGEIVVNDRMETNVPGVYAVGDVTGKMMLAHVASKQGLVAVENALGGDERMDYGVVPACIFTMPEIGSVGLREHEAAKKGMSIRTGRFPYRALGKAHAMGEITGMVKIIADAANDKVLGVHVMGAHATDVVHEGALAIKAGMTAQQLGSMIHAHPTLAEAVMEAAEDVHGSAIHVMPEKKS